MKPYIIVSLIVAAACGTHHAAGPEAATSPAPTPTPVASPAAATDAATRPAQEPAAMVARVRLDAAGAETADVSFALVDQSPAASNALADAFAGGHEATVSADLQKRADELDQDSSTQQWWANNGCYGYNPYNAVNQVGRFLFGASARYFYCGYGTPYYFAPSYGYGYASPYTYGGFRYYGYGRGSY